MAWFILPKEAEPNPGRFICLAHNDEATIIALNTGELLAEFTLNPDKNYQRKNG